MQKPMKPLETGYRNLYKRVEKPLKHIKAYRKPVEIYRNVQKPKKHIEVY